MNRCSPTSQGYRLALLSCLFLLGPAVTLGEDDLSSASAWLRQYQYNEAVRFRYDEVRSLDLLATPWQGWGHMVMTQSGTMIKHQIHPSRKLMAITGSELIYFDSDHGYRQRLPLDSQHPMARQMLILKDLLQGKLDAVRPFYDFHFQENAQDIKERSLRLTPKVTDPELTLPDITLEERSTQRLLSVRQPDGDTLVTTMRLLDCGTHIEKLAASLLKEAGDT